MPKRRITFGRINRRDTSGQISLATRPFRDDMLTLAAARNTEAVINGRKWIAADMEPDPPREFLTGVLGFEEEGSVRRFDPEAYSWKKGETTDVVGATERNLVPFAVDLHDKRRWVAFATSTRIKHKVFVEGFQAALNHAVTVSGHFPDSEWEVDLVTDEATIEQWVRDHPDANRFMRTIRFKNPGRDLDGVRAEMRSLGARVAREVYEAPSGESLKLANNPAFTERIEGAGTGDIDVELLSPTGGRFTTKNAPDTRSVPEFGRDLDAGTEAVLAALRAYVAEKVGPGAHEAPSEET